MNYIFCRVRNAGLELILKPLDFVMERFVLFFKFLVLRSERLVLLLERIHLRFQFFVLSVEAEQLRLLLAGKRNPSDRVSDFAHKKSPSSAQSDRPRAPLRRDK